ncbi:MAG: metallophosphoesterase [Leuconostoc falkenbergense]|uniref:metallophosphoesterase n=1 Tax=Leuconostoc falkenbergense TaxID=2766470 RepID=UPI003BB74E9D
MTTYTIASDFHQNAAALKYLFEKYHDTQIILLGDFFDTHGSTQMADAKTMAETIVTCYQNAKIKPWLVRGDHDDFIVGTAAGKHKSLSTWRLNNGKKTLKELGYHGGFNSINNIADFLNTAYPELIAILKQSHFIIAKPNIIFVHGGLNWSKSDPISDTSHSDAMWLREKYIYGSIYNWLNSYTSFASFWKHPPYHRNTTEKTIVSGHTPTFNIDSNADGNPLTLHNARDPKNINRYLIDGGSSYRYSIAHVNIVQFNEQGQLINQEAYTN